MILELHHVTIEPCIHELSLTATSGTMACITGRASSGKTTLLRAVLGLIPIDGGHISIDGELLTPHSAPYFRRMTAYVPQHLSLPEGYDGMGLEQWGELSGDERYLLLLRNAVATHKPLLVVDEPPAMLAADTALTVDSLLKEASSAGTAVLAVNSRILQNQIHL